MDTIAHEGSNTQQAQSPLAGGSPNLIHPLIIPPVVLLPMDQHLGSPAEPVVQVDEKVLKGQLIAKAKGMVSANIHASTSGTVVAVAQRSVYYDVAKRGTCVVIEADGEDKWVQREPCRDYQQVSSRDLLQKVRVSGIIDMEGEGLPAHICLSPKKSVDTLIVNACYWNNALNSDDVLLLNNAREVVIGIKIIRQLLDQPPRTVIALEAGKEKVAAALRIAIEQENLLNGEVNLYQEAVAGPDRQQLIETVTGQQLDDTSMASSVGCVCLNAATVYAIYRAVCLGEPATTQIITVNGDGFQRQQTLSVPLGTPLNFVLKQVGFGNFDRYKIRVNSLHNGNLLMREETPVNKRLSSLWSIAAGQDADAKQYPALDYLQGLEFFDAQAADNNVSVNHTNVLVATPAVDSVDTRNKTQRRSEAIPTPIATDAETGEQRDAGGQKNPASVNPKERIKEERATNNEPAPDNPNITLRSQNIQRLQDKLKLTEDKLEHIDPTDDEAAEALLLSINIIIEKIQAAKALREEENAAAMAAQNANNDTLRDYIGSLQERLALAQNQFANANRAKTTTQSAVKQALVQLEARLEDALANLNTDDNN